MASRSPVQPDADSRSGKLDLTATSRTSPNASSPNAPRDLPSGASVLRRGLLVWGLGHIAIGDRRGWLLIALQPVVILALLMVGVQLIDGTRWVIVFPPLVAILAFWVAQAIHAYRRAVELGATPGGELQAALFLPVAVGVLTVFWLIGGRHGSPTATLEAYAIAWLTGKPDAAAHLYVTPPGSDALAAKWSGQSDYLTDRVTALAALYGPTSGLDPDEPYDNLRFGEPTPAGPGRQTVEIDIVRSQRVEDTILGIVPTATQENVVVEPVGTITLTLVDEPAADWLPFGRLSSEAWRIEDVTIGPS
jgi:hypothetical protein